MRTMIVEDEILVALDMAKIVGDMTSGETLTLHSAAAAKNAAAHEDFDLAVLDVTLPDGMCFDVADMLLEQATPYIFVTAYPRSQIPLRHRAAPVVGKPYRETDVRAALSTLLVPPPPRPHGGHAPT